MKRNIVTLILIPLFFIAVSAQKVGIPKKDPVGKWKFELINGPEGYSSGIMNVGFAEKKYSATMIFTNGDYQVPGEKVSFVNDSLNFLMYAEGEEITVLLKLTNPQKMEGKIIYSEGELLLILTKEIKAE